MFIFLSFFVFFNDTATTEIYTLSLHDALPILGSPQDRINLKVTSTDHLGALGREEGMAALVVVLLVASGGSGAGE